MTALCRRGLLTALILFTPVAAYGGNPTALDDRERIVAALRQAGELDPHRGLAHVSHTCDLEVDGLRYPVVDVRELVHGASTPRGVNRVVVLSPDLAPLQSIAYTQQRPLFCNGSRLYLWDSLMIDELPPEGNVLDFSDGGRVVHVENVDVNDFPIYPAE
jgi:hypothetical protein